MTTPLPPASKILLCGLRVRGEERAQRGEALQHAKLPVQEIVRLVPGLEGAAPRDGRAGQSPRPPEVPGDARAVVEREQHLSGQGLPEFP